MPILARTVPFLSVLLLALLVAGCGGDDAASSTDAKVVPASDTSSATGAPTGAVDTAKGVELRASVKQHVNAIESCAVNNTDGSYTGCLDLAALREFEPSLATAPGEALVAPADDPTMSYVVTIALDGRTFTETHNADGSIAKTCAPADTTGCTGGTW